MVKKFAVLVFAGFLGMPCSRAGEAATVEQLREELRAMQQQFERVQREQREQIESLSRKIESLTGQTNKPPAGADTATPGAPAAAAAASPAPGAETAPSAAPGFLSMPLRSRDGSAYMDIGLVGTFAAGTSTADDIEGGLELGGHDPNQRGFTVQGVEASFNGAVDPYFRGAANVLFSVDSGGDSFLELEEAWLETVSLPAGLQLRAGQILTEFGRQNPTHPHSWAFVDTPLVLGRMFGEDGLRNPGARLSWLAPTPFYSEFMVGLQDSQGGSAESFRSGAHAHGDSAAESLPLAYRHAENDRGVEGVEDLLITPRYAASFDLTDSQTVLMGASAAFGPNSRGEEGAGNTDTQIYGLDFTWKWKSPSHHGGFPFVTFQTEGLLRKYKAGRFNWDENGNGLADSGEIVDATTGLPAVLGGETLTDFGFYSQVLYGFKKGWVAGLRLDYVDGNRADYEKRSLLLDGEMLGRDPMRAERWRLSPNLTWYPSEFSKIRLQYNYDERKEIGDDHSVWLQFEYVLGAHAAHKF